MKPLIDFLSELNTNDNTWGLYVDPENIDNYRIGQMCFDNGGLVDDYVFIGDLSSLSFGYQSTYECLESYLDSLTTKNKEKAELSYKGKKVLVNKEAIINLYFEAKLDEDFQNFLEKEINFIYEMWSLWETEIFIYEELPKILNGYEQDTNYSILNRK